MGIGSEARFPIRTILIFDFDGTVALGDGPVLAYAHHVAAALDDDGKFVDDIRLALNSDTSDYLDGYDAVRRAGEGRGADSRLLTAAYLASRAQLATEDAPITAAPGLNDFLAEMSASAQRLLVTNAPNIRISDALDSLDLTGCFDNVVTDAHKPAGLETLLAGLPPEARVLSVGDVWHNDLAPAHTHGHTTALVGDSLTPGATPTFRGTTFAELVPQLRAWISSSRA